MLGIYLGYFLDMILGDPYWLPHPIRWIGMMISQIEKLLSPFCKGKYKERLSGILLMMVVVLVSYVVPFYLLKVAYKVIGRGALLIEVVMIYQIMATRSLGVEVNKIYLALKSGDLDAGRKAVSYVVSRDTEEMTEEDVCKSALETVSENFADGVIAPLLFIFIGGAPLGFAYKAINTLDSMVGYKNEKYLNLGWASAKVDDLVNYLPARLSVVMVWIAAVLMNHHVRGSVRIVRRDHKNHASPNSAFPEAAFAGALGLQLGGRVSYFGEYHDKPTIGDKVNSIRPDDIKRGIHLMYASALIGLILMSIVAWLISLAL